MNLYKGIYYIKGGAEHAATFTFFKDRLSVKFNDEHNNGREVFWYYDEIVKENFRQSGNFIIRYKGYPEQIIETSSSEFVTEIEKHVAKENKRTVIKVVARVSPLLRVLFVIFLLLLAAYLWLVPYLAVRFAERVPVSYEENLGNSMFESMKPGFKIDERKTAYINDFFNELRLSSPYKIRITVVKDDVANAFAMPGGNIVVYDKIILGMNSYTELAALLSHEFTHVQNKHTTKSIFREMANSMFLSVILGNTGAASNMIIQNADELKSLSYGRSLEKEADLSGLRILNEHKIDGNGFIRLFEMLKKESTVKVSEWMSNHPDLDKRIDYIRHSPDFNKNGIAENETLKSIFERMKANN
ncbi:MAG: M48 family metallopeptidase [Chitinophagaceae bacterium]